MQIILSTPIEIMILTSMAMVFMIQSHLIMILILTEFPMEMHKLIRMVSSLRILLYTQMEINQSRLMIYKPTIIKKVQNIQKLQLKQNLKKLLKLSIKTFLHNNYFKLDLQWNQEMISSNSLIQKSEHKLCFDLM